jgi:hypothetical protein
MTTLATAPATDRHADRLRELEGTIEHGLSTFVDVGRALATIRDERLFLATHPSFRAYLQDRWNLGSPSAYVRIDCALVADAITASGAELPVGTSADSMRALAPLLRREGPAAVGRAWRIVEEHRGDQQRPPSRGEVRAALQSAGLVAPAAPKPKHNALEPIADRLHTAIRRVAGISARLDGRPLAPGTRQRAAELAELARQLAERLDALADASKAATRLQALEPEPAPLSDLCIGHGSRRDAHGLCTGCGRPDLYRAGMNGERELAGRAR